MASTLPQQLSDPLWWAVFFQPALMTLDDLTALPENARHPVIFLEGRRSIASGTRVC